MAWLEMSRDESHGGVGWEFGECLWCPTQRNGGGNWGYWELMRRVKSGDLVFHLKGKRPFAEFTGVSTADTDCYKTSDRPSTPGEWDHSQEFYRVSLRDFTEFASPIRLNEIFDKNTLALTEYHNTHSPASSPNGRYLFFVPQSGRLQCQNGAYLSELDDELISILFNSYSPNTSQGNSEQTSVNVNSQMRLIQTRIGQKRFSDAVRDNYQSNCCFPACSISDPRFLVGAHIARWSDARDLRGEVSNGLCLCLVHDRAFELGLFTLSDQLTVQINHKLCGDSKWHAEQLLAFDGLPIQTGRVHPSLSALRVHRDRVSGMNDLLGN